MKPREAKANVGATRRPKVVDAFLDALRAERIDAAFGVPGGLLHPLLAALEHEGRVRFIATKHEGGAAFMADGHARSSGRLALCVAVGGPGATNLMTGVAVAFADGVPMLVVTGQTVSTTTGKGALQETSREDIDVVGMFRPITKYSAGVALPETFGHHVRRALRRATTGRPGPVHLHVPVDLWQREVEPSAFEPFAYRPEMHPIDPNAIERAANLLLGAHHPVVLAGAGVDVAGAREQLRALVEAAGARVVTTPRGKSTFPEDHPLSAGVCGIAGHDSARRAIVDPRVDVLLTAGASLGETETFGWDPAFCPPGRKLVQLDIDPDRIGRNYPVEIALLGGCKETLERMLLAMRARSSASRWRDDPPVDRGPTKYDDPAQLESFAVPLTPQRWRHELQTVLPDDVLLFSDIGGHLLFNFHYLEMRAGQRFYVNNGLGSMGHGTAAPIGAALAHPGRPVVAIIGDACFMMHGMEIATAREYEIPVVWIVENNQMHGISWHGAQRVGGGTPLASTRYRHAIDVGAIAKAMGVRLWTVDRPRQMGSALQEALGCNEPAVIEVIVDGSVPPPLGERARVIAAASADRG